MVDEESIWWLVHERQPGARMEGNFEIPRMLIQREVGYRIMEQSDVRKSQASSVLESQQFQF